MTITRNIEKAFLLGILCLLILLASCFPALGKMKQDRKSGNLGVAIPMRDGKHLIGDIFLPSKAGKYPSIFIHTPYNRQYGSAPLPDELLAADLLDRDKFAYIIVDQRGRYGSKRAASGVKKINHGQDGHDVVEWIAKQNWSNGKVGTWGTSAVGSVQYQTAATRPPHLVCAVPASATYGYSFRQFYYSGVLKKHYLSIFTAVLSSRAKRYVTQNNMRNDFWDKAEAKFNSDAIDIPMMFVSGWFDTGTYLKIAIFKRFRKSAKKHGQDMKLILGPWLHTAIGKKRQGALEFPAAEGFADHEALRFFYFWLRGDKNSRWADTPPVRYFQMGENKWLSASNWPPPHTVTPYYLSGGGRLSIEKPGSEKPDVYVYEPWNPTPTVGGNIVAVRNPKYKIPAGPQDLSKKVENRKDVIIYTTDVLTQDVPVAGNVRVRLFISSDRKDTDFAVRLSDVYPDGRSMLVTDGIQRMRFRKSLRHPELMEPGRIYECMVTLVPTAQTFLAGHKIRISVSSSNYPKYDTNLNLDRKRLIAPKGLKATNSIYHDSSHPSALLLPIRTSQ
ncbi:MAG: CocE/NonD family hydrolase [Planctomycetota bacterium]|jgi:predicted acyl esterase